MLILLHGIWFQYMLPNLVYPDQGSIKQREQKKNNNNNKHVFPIIWEMYVYMRIQWPEKIVVHQFVMGLFKLEVKSKVTVKTTTLIYGGSDVLKLIKR